MPTQSPTGPVQDHAVRVVQRLAMEARDHRAVRHPLLTALARGTLPHPKAAIRDFVRQYLPYSMSFQRYLCGVIQQLTDLDHRTRLMGNLAEEAGRVDPAEAALLKKAGIKLAWVDGVPHPQLFRRFLHAVGMSNPWLEAHPACPEAEAWADLFAMVTSKAGPGVAVGALGLGTEGIVKHIYRPLIVAIRRDLQVSPRDRVFFDLHSMIDDEHGVILDQIAVDLICKDPAQEHEIRRGMQLALQLRASFFDTLQRRAEYARHQQ